MSVPSLKRNVILLSAYTVAVSRSVSHITIEGRVLKCYPKYLLEATAPKSELKQVLKVLEKYNSKEQIIRMYNDTSDSSAFNMLAVMLFLLQDYLFSMAHSLLHR